MIPLRFVSAVRYCSLAAVIILLSPVVTAAAASSPSDDPRLVLFIIIDQLRGDMPRWGTEHFGKGGFRRLDRDGVTYTNAHYRHATTFTAVGMATLATGGNPPEHGIVGNNWYEKGHPVYAVEDDRHRLLGAETNPHQGTSPRNLTAGTWSDELVVAGGGRSRVFSVSIKDRGAILPAGRLGKAYWYSSADASFVTSTYYHDTLPEWVVEFNKSGRGQSWKGKQWDLLDPSETYSRADEDDRPYERGYGSLGTLFPHPIEDSSRASYERTLPFTPMGDELTLAFVEALIEQEQPGRGDATDVLSVSFSCTDYVGHAFGPYSLEAEDNLRRLDRVLDRLFEVIDESVGLEHTIVVLSADHGVDATPEYHYALRCGALETTATSAPSPQLGPERYTDPDACGEVGRHYPKWMLEHLNAEVRRRLGVEVDLIVNFWNPSFTLDHAAVAEAGLDAADVERTVAEVLVDIPGVAAAFTRHDLLEGKTPRTPLGRRVLRAFHPTRSGDVILVAEPNWYLYTQPTLFSAMHGSPYAYDTHVPIMVMGPGIDHATVHRSVGPEDIASTLAILLGTAMPDGAIGEPLVEVLQSSTR